MRSSPVSPRRRFHGLLDLRMPGRRKPDQAGEVSGYTIIRADSLDDAVSACAASRS